MRPCPSCARPGILEHSVLVSRAELRAARDGVPRAFARCLRCGGIFQRTGSDTFAASGSDLPGDLRVHIPPPWAEPGATADFLMSWDVVEVFYERLQGELEPVRPLRALIGELRRGGFDARLRAGQSLSSLGLSRSRQHGLSEGQSHLFLAPQPDGRVTVSGRIGAESFVLGAREARLDEPLRAGLQRLAELPID